MSLTVFVYIKRMGPMQSDGLRTKYLSNVQHSWLIPQTRPARKSTLGQEHSNMFEVTEQMCKFRRKCPSKPHRRINMANLPCSDLRQVVNL